MKLIEGMILMVVREMGKYVVIVVKKQCDFVLFMEDVVKEVNVLLNCMLDLLFVLK